MGKFDVHLCKVREAEEDLISGRACFPLRKADYLYLYALAGCLQGAICDFHSWKIPVAVRESIDFLADYFLGAGVLRKLAYTANSLEDQ